VSSSGWNKGQLLQHAATGSATGLYVNKVPALKRYLQTSPSGGVTGLLVQRVHHILRSNPHRPAATASILMASILAQHPHPPAAPAAASAPRATTLRPVSLPPAAFRLMPRCCCSSRGRGSFSGMRGCTPPTASQCMARPMSLGGGGRGASMSCGHKKWQVTTRQGAGR